MIRLDRRPPEPAPAPVLDPSQRAVLEHRGSHLLVLAGPGTGKTTTLAELVVSRLQPGPEQLAPESVLALTFGRRAAQELAERISLRLRGGPVPVVATFHAFAYGLVRQLADPAEFMAPPRLLTASEQDARLRELLTHAVAEGRVPWPASLQQAVGTRGIAEQVRRLLTRAQGLDLDGAALRQFGRSAGLPAWRAIGRFAEEYAQVLDWEGSIDYAALIQRAIALAADERRGRPVREAYRLIVVDEYQDTDPAQVQLVRTLAAGGAQVVAVGDPDQAIYGFRGADVGGILRFPAVFGDPVTGAPAPTVVLRHTRRFRAPIAEAARGVRGSTPLPGLPADQVLAHRTPVTPAGEARVEARTYPSQAAEAAGVADLLLRARAGLDGPPLPWGEMAVLVRSPLVTGPVLVRALRGAGIPVAVAPDELALAEQPAVAVLLAVLGLALDPASAPADAGAQLLAGPLGRVDPVAIRALARAALAEQRAARDAAVDSPEPTHAPDRAGAPGDGPATESVAPAGAPPEAAGGGLLGATDWGVTPRSSRALTEAVAAGRLPAAATLPPRARSGFARVAGVVAAALGALGEDGLVAEVLWAAWSATDWPERLRRAALRGGPAGEAADRDLDAVVALFDLANRLPAQRRGRVGLAGFVDEVRALRVPQESWLPGQLPGDAVRLLSAHRSKGLEWELVVVAGVQEGAWPDLRLRSDLLHVEELTSTGRAPARTARDLLVEERRLMYVACTRARSALVVTAVAEPFDGGLQPSRFLEQLGVPVRAMGPRSAAPMDAGGLIAALRAAACAPAVLDADGAPDAQVERRRGAAIARLAALAGHARAGLGDGPLAAAHPDTWWGVRKVSGLEVPGADVVAGSPDEGPVDSEPEVVRLSPSAIEQLRRCPLQWFLEKRVGAGTPPGAAATLGTIVHEVARAIADGEVAADMAAITPYVDAIWAGLPFPARYQSGAQRERVDAMLRALLGWLAARPGEVLAAEAGFSLDVTTSAGPAHVRGSIDRVERDEHGRVHLVDFKTGRSVASQAATDEHPQLGVYQLAVREAGLAEVVEPDQPLAGAALVHLGETYADGTAKVRVQAALEDGETWVHALVADAVALARGPGYPARRNARCPTCAFRHLCPVQTAGAGPSPGATSDATPGAASGSGAGAGSGASAGSGSSARAGGGAR